MELACEPRTEDLIKLEYTTHLQHNKSLCSVCMADETKDGKQWHRSQLKCGHIAHTRCLRRWFSIRECVSCRDPAPQDLDGGRGPHPICGDIPEIKRNRFCSDCNKFDHSVMMDRCNKRRKMLDDVRYELIAFKA